MTTGRPCDDPDLVQAAGFDISSPEARRIQALFSRVERATDARVRRIVAAADLHVERDNAPGLYIVTGERTHRVALFEDFVGPVCDCEAFRHRGGPCKHIVAAWLTAGRDPLFILAEMQLRGGEVAA